VSATDVQVLIAELDEWVAARSARSRRHRYGPQPDHEADLMLPADREPDGVAVLLHGGFWRARFRRSLMTAMAIDLASRGWASWNVEYRRTGTGGGGSETLDDIDRAVEALVGLGESLPTNKIVAIGHSAGGQLALCAARGPTISAVISLAGVCDMVAAAEQAIGDNAVVEFLGALPSDDPAMYERTDPMQQLPTNKPVLLVHGDADSRVPVGLSRGYAAAAAAAGDSCELLELAGVEHFAVIDPRTTTWAQIAQRLPLLLP
jgi:acetyl esterase/lipase